MQRNKLTFNDLPKVKSASIWVSQNHPFITKPNMEVFQSLNKASTCLSIVMNWTNGWKAAEKENRL